MATDNETQISVGDHVKFVMGTSLARGVIVEDRGLLGQGGRRIFRVRMPIDPYEDEYFEMPEDRMEVIPPQDLKQAPITLKETKEYLTDGGLVSLLQAGTTGGNHHLHAWLCRDSLGNLTHTFDRERGMLGGAEIPFLALYGHRIFRPKSEDVHRYLLTFNLSQTDAEEVLSSIGLAP